MKKIPEVLFAVKAYSDKGRLIKPHTYGIIGSEQMLSRIPLAETVEDAILFTFPKLKDAPFKKLSFQVFAIIPSGRHRILSPKALRLRYGLPYSEELNEYGAMSRLRMELVGAVSISKTNDKNEDIIVSLVGEEVKLGTRYATTATV